MGALDEAAQQVWPVPTPAGREPALTVFGLRSRPEVRRDNRRHCALRDDVFTGVAADLAALPPELPIPGLAPSQCSPVDRIAEDHPDRALGPCSDAMPPKRGRGGDRRAVQLVG